MKNLILILMLLPFFASAKKKVYANVCDSLSKVVYTKADLSSKQITSQISNALGADQELGAKLIGKQRHLQIIFLVNVKVQ